MYMVHLLGFYAEGIYMDMDEQRHAEQMMLLNAIASMLQEDLAQRSAQGKQPATTTSSGGGGREVLRKAKVEQFIQKQQEMRGQREQKKQSGTNWLQMFVFAVIAYQWWSGS